MEYLKRELIESVSYKIEKDFIEINSDCTNYITINRIKLIEKNTLLSMYTKVRKLAKEKNTSIGRRGYKKYITEHWEKYENEVKYYNNLFDRIVEKSKEVQERGIHYGTSGDEVLNELMELRNKYIEVYYRNTVSDAISEIYHTLKKFYEGYTVLNKNYTKIFI